MDEDSLIALFCFVDDFCKSFEPHWNKFLLEEHTTTDRWWTTRELKLSMSEALTIAIFFHASGYRTFKHYYQHFVIPSFKPFFPHIVSYGRFNKLMKQLVLPLFILQNEISGKTEGLAFIDSTPLTVCHICRASRHKVFRTIAKKGKSSTGWFFGMKLHLVINHKAEIVSWMVTPGNVDDRKPVPYLVQKLFGKVFGDRGYIGKDLFERLYAEGIQLITRLKLNMKNMLMDAFDKLVLYKRGIIEPVNSQLKTICQIEHRRYRSVFNFIANLISGLVHKPYIEPPWIPKMSWLTRDSR